MLRWWGSSLSIFNFYLFKSCVSKKNFFSRQAIFLFKVFENLEDPGHARTRPSRTCTGVVQGPKFGPTKNLVD